MTDVVLPELGEDITCATIACWHVKVGDSVTMEHDIVELVTDKAVFNVPSPVKGNISKIFYPEGESAHVGAILAKIDTGTTE